MLKDLAKAYLKNFVVWFLGFKSNSALVKNKIWKDKYKGKRLFLLGSGRTVNNHDLSLLKDEIVMTQNNFHVHKDINKFTSAFHVVVPNHHPQSESDRWISWFLDMEKALPASTHYFFGLNCKEMIEKSSKSLAERSYYIRGRYNPLARSSAPVDISNTIMSVATVLTQCLAISIYMGFEKIYLVGFDLDQICDKQNQGRFYGASKITDTDAERKIDKDLMGTTAGWFYWWLMFKQFDLLRHKADSLGIKIYNATGGGMLDNFERVDYKSLFQPETGAQRSSG
jgi:hypothetical protein